MAKEKYTLSIIINLHKMTLEQATDILNEVEDKLLPDYDEEIVSISIDQ